MTANRCRGRIEDASLWPDGARWLADEGAGKGALDTSSLWISERRRDLTALPGVAPLVDDSQCFRSYPHPAPPVPNGQQTLERDETREEAEGAPGERRARAGRDGNEASAGLDARGWRT